MSSEVQTAPNPAPRSRFPLVKSKSFLLAVAASLIGFVWRKSLRAAFWIAGSALAVVVVARWLGIGLADWRLLESDIRGGLSAAIHEAEAARRWLLDYLPSGFLTLVGAWRGSRRG